MEYTMIPVRSIPFRGTLYPHDMQYCRGILFVSSALMVALMYDITVAAGDQCVLTYFYDVDTTDPEVVVPTGNNMVPPFRDLRMIKSTVLPEYLYMKQDFLQMLAQENAAGTEYVYKVDDVIKRTREEELFDPQYQRFKCRTFWMRHVEADKDAGPAHMKVLFVVAEAPRSLCTGLSSIDFSYVMASAIPPNSNLSCREQRTNNPLMPLEDPHTIPGVERIFPDRDAAMDYLRSMLKK